MQTPAFASMTCDMVQWKKELPKCLTDVFMSLVLQLAWQSQRKKSSDETCLNMFETWSDVPGDIQEQILEMGAFSFRMLHKRQFQFTERELQQCGLSDAARRLGLLVVSDEDEDVLSAVWCFCHLSLQEALAALYLAMMCSGEEDALWLVRRVGARTAHLSTFWMLYAAQPGCELVLMA